MKFLFVVNDAWFFASHRLAIASALIEEGHDVHVMAKADASVLEIEDAGVKFHTWGIHPRGQNPLSELKAVLHLAVVFYRIKPDLVHFVTIKPVLYGGIVGRLMKVPAHVYAVSGLGALFQPGTSRVRAALLRFLYRFAAGHRNALFIFQNEENRRRLLEWIQRDDCMTALINGSGVDLLHFKPVPEPAGVCQVLLPARILKDKGISEFVAAAEQIHSLGIEARFIVAGGCVADGNPAAYSKQELQTLKDSQHVEFLGHVTAMVELYQSSHIVVLPSYHEGLPKCLTEAAACSRAVVTTDVPGCRDAVIPGESAILVPVKNSAALAEAIALLIRNKHLRQQKGREGLKLAREVFDIKKVVWAHLRIYSDLTNHPRIETYERL